MQNTFNSPETAVHQDVLTLMVCSWSSQPCRLTAIKFEIINDGHCFDREHENAYKWINIKAICSLLKTFISCVACTMHTIGVMIACYISTCALLACCMSMQAVWIYVEVYGNPPELCCFSFFVRISLTALHSGLQWDLPEQQCVLSFLLQPARWLQKRLPEET